MNFYMNFYINSNVIVGGKPGLFIGLVEEHESDYGNASGWTLSCVRYDTLLL